MLKLNILKKVVYHAFFLYALFVSILNIIKWKSHIAYYMDISDKLVYLIGPVAVAVTLYIRYRWRKQEQKESLRPFKRHSI
jgi:hypothetical protein